MKPHAPGVHGPGMRLSWADVAVMVVTGLLTVWLRHAGMDAWWMPALVLGHFFLFCNVFRVRRSLELAWAAVFVLLTGWRLMHGDARWLPLLAWQAPVTVLVVALEMRSPRYHGAAWRLINPKASR